MNKENNSNSSANGAVFAIVLQSDDPERRGRIQIRLAFAAEQSVLWARCIRLPVQLKRDDEVLVTFEFGTVDHPIIIGVF